MASVLLKRGGAEFKAEKFESVVRDEGLEHGNIQARLLRMEQQIPALTGGEKIRKSSDASQWRFEQFLPAAPYFVGRGPKSSVGNKFASGPDIAAASFAV